MSFILDALNKAQREREEQREPVPQLTTVHYTPEPVENTPPRINSKIALGGGVLAICVIAMAVGFWVFSGEEDVAPPMSTSQVASVAPSVSSPAETVRSNMQPQNSVEPNINESPASEPHSEEADKAAVAGLYENVRSEPEVAPKEPVVAPPPVQIQPESRVVTQAPREVVEQNRYGAVDRQRPAASNQPAAQPPRPTAVIANPTPVVVAPSPVPVVAVPAQPQDSITSRVDIPYLQQLSWATQQRLPSLLYSEHHYHGDPAQRSVVINASTHRVGSQVAGGLVLQEILQDGVIMQFESRPFKVDALNSWVNF